MKNLYLFDCFGVVVSDVSQLFMEPHFTTEQIQYIRKEVYRKVDCGLLPFDESIGMLAEMLKTTKQQVRAEWDRHIYPLTDTLEVIDKVRASGGTTALLSNASVDYINQLFTQFDLYKYFDKLFVSSCYGCAKPDRKFYEICLNSFTEKFDNIYFTDDNPNNLVGLEQLGIKPLLFTSAKQLLSDLKLN